MKTRFFIIPALAGLIVLLPGCLIVETVPGDSGYEPSQDGRPRPSRPLPRDDYDGSGGSRYSQDEREAYREGVAWGLRDARDSRSFNAGRHSGEVRPSLRPSFAQGYGNGYQRASTTPSSDHHHTNTELEAAYERGYEHGERDREQGRSYDYRHHPEDYSRYTEESYRSGYQAGFQQRSSRF